MSKIISHGTLEVKKQEKHDPEKQSTVNFLLSKVMANPKLLYIWAPGLGKDFLRTTKEFQETRDFENWIQRLKEGALDSRKWLFEPKLESNLKQLIRWLQKNAIDVRQKKGELPSWTDFQIDQDRFMRTGTLFKYHPRGTSAQFYEDLLLAIQNRKKEIAAKKIGEMPADEMQKVWELFQSLKKA